MKRVLIFNVAGIADSSEENVVRGAVITAADIDLNQEKYAQNQIGWDGGVAEEFSVQNEDDLKAVWTKFKELGKNIPNSSCTSPSTHQFAVTCIGPGEDADVDMFTVGLTRR